MSVEVGVRKLVPEAQVPTKAHERDACFDLYAHEIKFVDDNRVAVSTGIALDIPSGYAGFIEPRSSLAINWGVVVLGGVIDSGYEGDVTILLLFSSLSRPVLNRGQRIAQIHFRKVEPVLLVEKTGVGVSTNTATNVTSSTMSLRGVGGFGSTGQ